MNSMAKADRVILRRETISAELSEFMRGIFSDITHHFKAERILTTPKINKNSYELEIHSGMRRAVYEIANIFTVKDSVLCIRIDMVRLVFRYGDEKYFQDMQKEITRKINDLLMSEERPAA